MSSPAPSPDPIVAVRRTLLEMSINIPDDARCAEVLRRRLIALIAQAGFTMASAAAAAGLHHSMVVRKLAHPDRPAAERRPLDESTIAALLSAIARAPSALVSLDVEPGDEEVLQWLSAGRQAARKVGTWLDAKRHSEAMTDAIARWPDANERIARLVAAGFVTIGDGPAVVEDAAKAEISIPATLSITPTGTACAVR